MKNIFAALLVLSVLAFMPSMTHATNYQAAANYQLQQQAATTITFTGVNGKFAIAFNPGFSWQCGETVSVTFTNTTDTHNGFNVGDTIQFTYSQFSSQYPSQLYPVWTDPPLTLTSISGITYPINPLRWEGTYWGQYPLLYVTVQDMTVPNGDQPLTLFSESTGIYPQQCMSVTSTSPVYSTPVNTIFYTSLVTSFVTAQSTVNSGTTTLPASTVPGPVVSSTQFLTTSQTTTINVTTALSTIMSTTSENTTVPGATVLYTSISTIPVTISGWIPPPFFINILEVLGAITAALAVLIFLHNRSRRKYSTRLGGKRLPAMTRLFQRKDAERKSGKKETGKRGPGRPRKSEQKKEPEPKPVKIETAETPVTDETATSSAVKDAMGTISELTEKNPP